MTSDQRIALSVFVALLIVGGGVFLIAAGSSGGDSVDCSSGEIRGVPIREGQTPDTRACEAMDFAVRFYEASAEECADLVSSELAGECDSKAEIEPSEWVYVGDSGIDPSSPNEMCVALAHDDGFRTVSVEQVGDALKVVGSGC